MKLLFMLINLSVIVFCNTNIQELLPYKLGKNNAPYNVIIILNQINEPFENQQILNRVMKKSKHLITNVPYINFIDELFENGYQIILISYLNRNELFQPKFNKTHLYYQYNIRSSRRKLNQERKIFSDALQSIDSFVTTQYYRRPLCIIFHLPPKLRYQLEIKNKNDHRTFEEKRDFALINLYHDIHKRRYLYPNKLLVYSSLSSDELVLIDNK